MKQFVKQLQEAYPDLSFQQDSRFYWNPQDNIICYVPGDTSTEAIWSLLHELAHGLLQHKNYQTDLELLFMEAEAWEHAKILQHKHASGQPIDEEHIQDCLDTYRDWLYSRSVCPKCDQVGIQKQKHEYQCINCVRAWRVSEKRFTRPYRLCVSPKLKTSPGGKGQQMKFYSRLDQA